MSTDEIDQRGKSHTLCKQSCSLMNTDCVTEINLVTFGIYVMNGVCVLQSAREYLINQCALISYQNI